MITKLHNNRIVLICGDALEWLPKIKAQANLIVADPPYWKVTKEAWDNEWKTAEAYTQWCQQWFTHCNHLLTATGSLYMWQSVSHQNNAIIFDLAVALRTLFTFQDWITWQKSRGFGNRKGWLLTREECLWFSKTQEYIWNDTVQYDLTAPTNRSDMGFNGKPRKSQFKRYTNVWQCNEDQNYGSDRIRAHYTPKPLILIERIVNVHTLTSDHVVVDPFMGSGTTGVACVNLDRRFIGIEKDQESYNFAVDRIQKAIERNADQTLSP